SVNGALTRSVADTALFLEAVTGERYVDAVAPPDRPLKIAWSVKKLPGQAPWPKLDREIVAATEQTAELLRSLGHTVEQIDPDYGAGAFWNFLARYLRGIDDDVQTMPHPDKLEKRTLGMARMGRMWPKARVAKFRA